MTSTRPSIKAEMWPMIQLAWPVVVAELGWMGMAVVDAMMVGPLGASALGGVGVGSMVHFNVAIFAYGLMYGLDTLVSQAFGARRIEDCRAALRQGLWLALALTPLVMLVIEVVGPRLGQTGIRPEVAETAWSYLRVVNLSTLPLLVFGALRRYMQAVGLVRQIMVTLLFANVLNATANWLLIHGVPGLGLAAQGVAGSAWATFLSRLLMMFACLGFVLAYDRNVFLSRDRKFPWPEWGTMRQLVGLGWPAAVQTTLEVGVFAAATYLAAWFEPTALAAYQIVLNLSSVTFMVPLGVSAATAVRVGHAVGRGDPLTVRVAGWAGLILGVGFMGFAAFAFLCLPRTLLGLYGCEPEVIQLGVGLLAVAALFQLFDGTQVVIIGALRGLGETRIPMYCGLVAYWFLGLPLGAVLAFRGNLGVLGLWIGLSLGLILTGVVLLGVWSRRSRALGLEITPPSPSACKTPAGEAVELATS